MQKLREIFLTSTGLKDHHFDEFVRLSESRTLKKKDFLLKAGTVSNFVALIEDGILRSYVENGSLEFNTDFYFENNFISAYSSFVTQLPTEHFIQALTDARVLCFPLVCLEDLVQHDPEWLRLGKYLAEFFLVRKCQRELSFLKHSAAERMENMLIAYPGIEQKVQQYHIASYLGIKPESLSRIKLTSYTEK